MKELMMITGANGFIGSRLARASILNGRRILGIIPPWEKCRDVLFSGIPGHVETSNIDNVIKLLEENFNVLCIGDIADKNFVNALYKTIYENGYEISHTAHLAACAIVREAAENKAAAWQANFIGTKNLLDATTEYSKDGSPLFIHFSTDKVYGEGSERPYLEDDPIAPVYVYDRSKAEAESLVFSYHEAYNIRAVVVRMCNVYGPGDLHRSRLIPGTLYNILCAKRPPLLRLYKGKNGEILSFKRDLIYVDDIVEAVSLIMENGGNKDVSVYNLGTEKCYSVDTVIHMIQEIAGCVYIPDVDMSCSELREQCMSFQKAKRELGFYPKTSLYDGLKKTVEWYEREAVSCEWTM